MPESAPSDSVSSIRISLGRLQALERDFQQHKEFWIGQEPYMRAILETTQIIQQGLVAALAKLDKRQGQAIQNLSNRIDNLLDRATASSAKPVTGQGAAVSDPNGETPSSGQDVLDGKTGALLHDLMQQIESLHEEIASVRKGQSHILEELAQVHEQMALQNGALGYLYQKAASQDGLLPNSGVDDTDHETDARASDANDHISGRR